MLNFTSPTKLCDPPIDRPSYGPMGLGLTEAQVSGERPAIRF